jgi:hypothetical protein
MRHPRHPKKIAKNYTYFWTQIIVSSVNVLVVIILLITREYARSTTLCGTSLVPTIVLHGIVGSNYDGGTSRAEEGIQDQQANEPTHRELGPDGVIEPNYRQGCKEAGGQEEEVQEDELSFCQPKTIVRTHDQLGSDRVVQPYYRQGWKEQEKDDAFQVTKS